MIVSRQGMQRLLKIEREYKNALIYIEEISKNYNDTSNQLKSKQEELLNLYSQITYYKNEIAKYNEITVEVEEYVREREDEISRLNSKASHYEVKLNNLIKENEDLTNLIKEYKQEVQHFELSLMNRDTEINSYKVGLKEREEKINYMAELLKNQKLLLLIKTMKLIY